MEHTKTTRTVPCGCRTCGCVCEAHAGVDLEAKGPYARFCPVHAWEAVTRTILHEAGALVSLALFGAMVLVWAAIFAV